MTGLTLSQKLLKVQQRIQTVTKSGENPEFNSTYVELNTVLALAKPVLNELGVFIAQGPGKDQNGHYVETTLIDADTSQSISGRVYFTGTEENMHKIAAAITYGRRVGLISLLALESEDDDGNTAVGKSKSASKPTPASKPVAKPTAEAKPQPPVPAPVPTSPAPKASREVINRSISTHSQVIIGKKLKTQDELMAMVKSFGADTKEKLTDENAEILLGTLQELIKPQPKAA